MFSTISAPWKSCGSGGGSGGGDINSGGWLGIPNSQGEAHLCLSKDSESETHAVYFVFSFLQLGSGEREN